MNEPNIFPAAELIAIRNKNRQLAQAQAYDIDEEYINWNIYNIQNTLLELANDGNECTIYTTIEAWAYGKICQPFIEHGYQCVIREDIHKVFFTPVHKDPGQNYATCYEVEVSAEDERE